MKFDELLELIRSDLYRHGGASGAGGFFLHLFRTPGFKYAFWMRLCAYLRRHRLLRWGPYFLARLMLERISYRYGISIPFYTCVGRGLYIGHYSGIFVNENCVIGNNCNLSQGVTLGQSNRGKRRGYPVIGNNVYIAPGAKIIGAVKVGNGAAIGANCVVTKDVPDNAVVGGVPGRVISYDGSRGYVEFTDY